jgi:hypothetical protein
MGRGVKGGFGMRGDNGLGLSEGRALASHTNDKEMI